MGAVERPATKEPAYYAQEATSAQDDGDAIMYALLSVSASVERAAFALGQLSPQSRP